MDAAIDITLSLVAVQQQAWKGITFLQAFIFRVRLDRVSNEVKLVGAFLGLNRFGWPAVLPEGNFHC